MQIHDLNTKALTNPAYVAFDDGTDTYKADFKAEIDNAAADAVADADLTDNTVAFTSGDSSSPTEWTAVDVLTSGLPIKTLFSRISTMIKNVRWLYSKLGTTDISSIGGGTVTGAISSLNSKLTPYDFFTATNSSIITDGLCRGLVDKTSKTARISLYARHISQNIPTNTTMFTLPKSARPKANWGAPAIFILADGTVAIYYIVIKTTGVIDQGFSSSVRGIFSSVEYAINQ